MLTKYSFQQLFSLGVTIAVFAFFLLPLFFPNSVKNCRIPFNTVRSSVGIFWGRGHIFWKAFHPPLLIELVVPSGLLWTCQPCFRRYPESHPSFPRVLVLLCWSSLSLLAHFFCCKFHLQVTCQGKVSGWQFLTIPFWEEFQDYMTKF